MKNYLITIFIVIATIFALIFSVNNKNKESDNTYNSKLTIVTTLFPFYDMAKQIGGDSVEVSMLVPPGVESHSYEPKPSDIIKINESDVFIFSGDLMEPWVKDILNGLSKDSNNIFDASLGVEIVSDSDPHYWLDFTNMIEITKKFTNILKVKSPQNSNTFQEESDKYISSLFKLDLAYTKGLANCKTREIFYAGHYAFGFLSKKYHLIYKAAYGISPDSEPTANDISGLIDQMKKDKIKFVFYEELINPRVANTIAKETGASVLELNPAHNLLKEQFTNGETFFSIMSYNLDNLKVGLQCQ